MLSTVPLHEDEVPVDETVVRALLRAQRPDLADAPVGRVGGGTDNTMYRVGSDLLARLPRTPGHVAALQKELTWLPRLRGRLPCRVPEPVFAGLPGRSYPLPWALVRWIDGEEASPRTIVDESRFGSDLAAFVRALRSIDLEDASAGSVPTGSRGGALRHGTRAVEAGFERLRSWDDVDIDLPALEARWRGALALPDPTSPPGWLHGDLKPSNLLVRNGRLHAVIDFGALCVGFPDAEHATTWDLPAAAREAYRDALRIDDATWARATGWAIAVGVVGLTSYRETFPAFAEECRRRLRRITA